MSGLQSRQLAVAPKIIIPDPPLMDAVTSCVDEVRFGDTASGYDDVAP
jgi:hypothetical protein